MSKTGWEVEITRDEAINQYNRDNGIGVVCWTETQIPGSTPFTFKRTGKTWYYFKDPTDPLAPDDGWEIDNCCWGDCKERGIKYCYDCDGIGRSC